MPGDIPPKNQLADDGVVSTTKAPRASRLLFIGLMLIFLVKASILALVGPVTSNDSAGYLSFADAILDGGKAFAPIAWGTQAVPPFIFRPMGYPLVLAAAKQIAPEGYAVVTIVFQCVVDGIVLWPMFAVSVRLLRASRAALVAVLLYAGSTSLLWDNAILSDSLYASLWNIVVFVLLGYLLQSWRLRLWHCLALGLLWGFSLWVRDVGLYFTVLPVILFVAIAAWDPARRRAVLAGGVAFLVAAAAMAGGTVLLNFQRTGEAFFSITGMENWLRPVFDMAQAGQVDPFAGGDLVSTTARETMSGDYGFENQLVFFERLHERCACTPTQMQKLAFAKYRATVLRYPIPYARTVVRHFNYFALGELIADPVATLNQFFELGLTKPSRRLPGLSLRNIVPLSRDFSATTALLMLLSAAGEAVSAIVFTAYLFGTPYVLVRSAWRRHGLVSEEVALAFLWFSFVAVSIAFSLVHYEARHALPLLPAAAIGVVATFQRLRRPA